MQDHLSTVLTAGVLGFMGVRLAGGVRHSRTGAGRELTATIVRGVRWRHFWPVPFVLTGVLAVAVPLMSLPVLSWGWWSALGGSGNPVFGSSSATSGSALEWIVPLVFVAMLIPALPVFAHAEEMLFRRGAEGWSKRRRVLKVLQFGMVHALIGIPLGAALALSVGGAYFMAVYLRAIRHGESQYGATIESARAHAVYNATIVVLVLVALGVHGRCRVSARTEVVDIEVHRSELVRLTFADGVVAELPVAELRAVCPCAGCRGRRERGEPVWPMPGRAAEIAIVDAELAGAWGLSLRWSDGHDAGIYSWDALRDWWDAGRRGQLVNDPVPEG